MKLEETLQHFSLSEEDRGKIKAGDERKAWTKQEAMIDVDEYVPEPFVSVARSMLSGYFEVIVDGKVIRKVYPTCVEIYYHEEEGLYAIKDYIVYHRNKPERLKKFKSQPSRFDIGNLHAHQSGIDITFEHEAMINGETVCVRASALIRAFRVEENGFNSHYKVDTVDIKANKEDTRSTYLYNALFSNLPLFKGFTIQWADGDAPKGQLVKTIRQNVLPYETKDDDDQKVPDKKAKTDGRCWQFFFLKENEK